MPCCIQLCKGFSLFDGILILDVMSLIESREEYLPGFVSPLAHVLPPQWITGLNMLDQDNRTSEKDRNLLYASVPATGFLHK